MAMLYTPQQLAGGASYSGGIRVGNWFEDIDNADTKVKDYIARRERGELASSKESMKDKVLNQKVPHAFSRDGTIQYGDTIMLTSAATDCPVTGNHFRAVSASEGTSFVSIDPSGQRTASASNTLVLTRDDASLAEAKVADGKTLCYGDLFYLCSNPSLRVDPRTNMMRPPLFLSSVKLGLQTGLNGNQGCFMTMAQKATARWKVLPLDTDKAVLYEGKPVPANEPVRIQHKTSNMFLAGFIDKKLNGGVLCCKNFKIGTGRKGMNLGIENSFSFVTAKSEDAAIDNRVFKSMTPELILEKVRTTINERGAYAIRGLGRSFRIMDDAGDGMLDREDFQYGLSDFGVHLGDDEFEMVMDIFDSNKDGFVSFDEFLRAVRGPMAESRVAFVQMAYALLDANSDGQVCMKDVEIMYDASQHPDVVAGKATAKDVLTKFMSQWDKDGGGLVTFDEFLDYYADVSASIDSDDYFELMMRNAWHISGGEGWLQNTTCRRVLVIHEDDTQTVEEIQNDLGIGPKDIEKMKQRLIEQGITDIKAIKLTA